MYRNVKAEMKRQNLTLTELADKMGCSVATLCNKLNGKTILTFKEAQKIKEILGVDIPLVTLFEEVV